MPATAANTIPTARAIAPSVNKDMLPLVIKCVKPKYLTNPTVSNITPTIDESTANVLIDKFPPKNSV